MGGNGKAPLIRALVPIQHKETFAGAAEFLLDGSALAAALRKLDRDLARYAILIFVLGGSVIGISLGWTFRRLQQANRSLFERTQSLLRANHELTLSAKTAAIGAITAHLIHDLKSPLFGLQSFVSSRGTGDDDDWKVAIDTTERMQRMIADVVRILQEERITESYDLSPAELLSILSNKVSAQAADAGVRFDFSAEADTRFGNRDANIILLVVSNLVQNAIQASRQGGRVSVRVKAETNFVSFEIIDTGPGLSPNIVRTLFTPCRSTKEGGTGLGLAISHQLAAQIGAELTLKETSSNGTTFQLKIPERITIGSREAALG
jgi:signal transduction histidine kinase